MKREALVVLGMHRSGTSALTRVLSLLGADLPATLMTAHEDNPLGYWESRRMAKFNNRLLLSAGLSWDSDAPIPSGWFHEDGPLAPYVEEARLLIREEYGNLPLVGIKDPRLCRLFPFWERVLASEGFDCKPVLCLRDPREVASSLALRCDDPVLQPAGIRAQSRALLLWLRHVLDAERFTRHLPRLAVEYQGLIADWRRELAGLPELSGGLKPLVAGDPRCQWVDQFLAPGARRQVAPDEPGRESHWLGLLKAIRHDANAAAGAPCLHRDLDSLTEDVDRLVDAYRPLRAPIDRLAREDPWADRILDELATLHPFAVRSSGSQSRKGSVLFVTRTAHSRAHQYRVIHAVEALHERQWNARWIPAAAPGLNEAVGDFDAVVVSRGPWGEAFQGLRRACVEKGVPIVCDVDDLTFERDALERGHVEHFNGLTGNVRESMLREAGEFQSALASCDAALATTAPLARATAKHAPRSFLLPNCLGRDMLSAAETWLAQPRPSSRDGLIRIGFASGTPTHQRDFGSIADVLADFLSANRHARLVLLGYLDVGAFPRLASQSEKIERRPAVPLVGLPGELARFDINLAPLETGNPFCEAKSEIRYTAASALGIPTVAAASEPLAGAIIDGVSGFLARSEAQWRDRLQALADDEPLRMRIGEAARIDVIARFAPRKTGVLLERFLSTLLPGALEASRP